MSRVFKISEGIPILEGMFKGIDRSMLESILVECGNDVDKAATALDGIFPDARIPLPSATSSTSTTNETEDERIARELQAQFDAETKDAQAKRKQAEEDERVAQELAIQFLGMNTNDNLDNFQSTNSTNPLTLSIGSDTHDDNNADELLSDEEFARRLQQMENDKASRRHYSHDHFGSTKPYGGYSKNRSNNAIDTFGGNNNTSFPMLPNMSLEDLVSKGLSQEDLDSLLANIKTSLLPVINEQFNGVKLPAMDENIDVPKVGLLSFGCGEVEIDSVNIPEDKITIKLDNNSVIVDVVDISGKLNKFDWFYNKSSFPKLSDSGKATASLSSATVHVVFSIGFENNGPVMKVTDSVVKCGKIDVKISDTKVSFLYNIILSIVIRVLKAHLETTLSGLIRDAFNNQAGDFMFFVT